MKRTTTAALLLGLVCAVPASASYFFNSEWGTMLNVGSAPNPTPDQLRAIGDSKYPTVAARARGKSTAVAASRVQSRTALVGEREVYKRILAAKISPKQEKRLTADLNRGSLVRAKAASLKAASAKTIATTKAAKTTQTKKTAAASVKPANPKADAKGTQSKSRS
jgi:ABC-type uncharacterized transport system permease subunit